MNPDVGNIIGNITPPNGVPRTTTDFSNIIGVILRVIVIAGFLIAFILLMVGGISWMLSGGDEKSIAKARGRITAALIGLIILLSAIAIMELVGTIFNIEMLKTLVIPIPTP